MVGEAGVGYPRPRVGWGSRQGEGAIERDNAPAWNGKPGHYEVWFVTLSDGHTGFWIRSTLHAPTGAAPEGRVWFARFDRDRPERTVAMNAAWPMGQVHDRPDPFELQIGDCMFASGRAAGRLSGEGHEVEWELTWPTGDETLRLLPDALYRGGLAPTKPFSPNPATRFTGTVTIDGEQAALDGIPGQQGHLHGSKHAERWAWAHCTAFDGEDDIVLSAITAQGKRGPFTTPFTTFVSLRVNGRWIRLSRISRKREQTLGAWRIDLGDRQYRLTGRVAADPSLMVQARYLDPDGTPRWCHNSEVASSRFVLFERRAGGFDEVASLSSVGTTHAEWAGRTPAPGEFVEHRELGKTGEGSG
jgi:hypothetical protein